MSTNNYQAFQPGAEGERNDAAPPPAFNPDAVIPSDYAHAPGTYGTITSPQPPTATHGQSPPMEIHQQPITYPTLKANIHYVNQHGDPVVVIPPQYPPQNMVHVQPQPQQKSALIPPTPYLSYHDYKHPNKSDRRKRICAAFLGIISCILLVFSMASHELAVGTEDGYDYECNVLYIQTDNSEVSNKPYAYYGEFCLSDEDSSEDWIDADSSDWCYTWRGALCWIGCIVLGCVMSCLGTCWVQPWGAMGRCCCPGACPRICYAFALVLCIAGNVLWVTNDKVCLDDDGYDLDIGSSVYLVSLACVVIFLTIFCAK